MELPLAVGIGALASAGLFLLLQRSVLKAVFGLFLISHAANLTILTVGRLRKGAVPIAGEDGQGQVFTDPLVQALILTAIVIGFGVAAFLLTLTVQAHKEIGSDDLDDMREIRG
ncbi:MAG: Na(+)/H(+) antiporter subunit C [SAR202 cluster bacterium]|nr:Na(+)/H(+) antiporter subunit C [SAR202 cluster bacterium]